MRRLLQLTSIMIMMFLTTANAQVTITGDDMLCPQGTGTLSTGVHDSYQWLRREYGQSTVANPISGATSQTLVMDYYSYALCYISVEVTDGSVIDTSAEVLVDGWVFAGPTVSTTGDFTIVGQGDALLCVGDTLYLTFLNPYTQNITWFNNGSPISGQNGSTLTVTGPGNFTVSGAPAECPNYIASPGVTITVITSNCGLGVDEEEKVSFSLYPNPAKESIAIEGTEAILGVTISNSLGQVIATHGASKSSNTIDVSDLESGIYFITVMFETGQSTQQFCVN